MDKKEVMRLVENYARNVSEVLPVREVLLFGSWARGDQREFSDIDVAVVVQDWPEGYLDTLTLLYKMRRDVALDIEPHLMRNFDDPSGFGETVKSTGITIYPPSSSLREKADEEAYSA